MLDRTPRFLIATISLAFLAHGEALAQQPSDDSYREAAVESFGLDEEEERESTIDEARQGPSAFSTSSLEATIDIETIERTGAAMSRLEGLVQSTPVADTNRAEYMFRLAELYYQRARYYEQRAFNRRDEAYELQETNPQRARAYEENAAADLDQSDEFAQQAITLYAELYREYQDTYPDIDAVLYYLGANMLQVEQNLAARTIFEELARNYPRSQFLPQALLMLGELDFAEGEMEDALMYYQAVAQFPDSPVYADALYKQAWCVYNLARDTADYEEAVQLLYDAIIVAEQDDRKERLRRNALRDMALFYSEVYAADVALGFFDEIAPDMSFELLSRLARIYGDRGEYEASNTLYRELIALNSQSFDIVGYQREIVRNTRPSANEVEIVRELRRLMELFDVARGLPDATPTAVQRASNDLELLLRQLATTYHSDAQTTQNEQLYGLAYNLYQDYIRYFPDSQFGYTMWFYYGELLYRNEEWLLAAQAYDESLARSQGDGAYDTEATYAACHAYMKMVELEATAAADTGVASANEGELPPVPEAQPISEEYQRMLTACDRYLDTNPSLADAVQIEYVVAFMYYTFDHLDEAENRFGSIAMNHIHVDPVRATISAELLLDSLALKRDFSTMKQWIDTFRATPELNQGEFGTRLALLSEQVDFNECRAAQDRGEHKAAGYCFIDFVNAHFDSELVDRALYNSALAFESADLFEFALEVSANLIEIRPNSPLVPEMLYENARTYHRMAMYRTAAEHYEAYAQRDASGENVRDALINAQAFRFGLGEYDEAIAALQSFIRTSDASDPEQRAAIAEADFQIGRVYEESGRTRDAIDKYDRFIADHGNVLPGRALEASVKIGDLYMTSRNEPDRAYSWYETTLRFWNTISPEVRAELPGEARDAAARAQFMLAERVFDEFEAVPLTGNEAQVQENLRRKIELGQAAGGLYTEVLEFGRPGYSIAAFTRFGQLYHVFYLQLIDAPIPPGLSSIEIEVYQQQIEEQAEDMKIEAMTAYGTAIDIARAAGYFSEFSERAASLYQQLDPTFKAGTEVRINPGYDGESFYRSGFVMEIEERTSILGGDSDASAPSHATDEMIADREVR